MSKSYIGKSIRRLEDKRFLTGTGKYIDDVKLPGMASMAILRSPHAHAFITKIDMKFARAMEGVIDVFCANDLEDELPEIPLRLAPFTDFQRFLQTIRHHLGNNPVNEGVRGSVSQ